VYTADHWIIDLLAGMAYAYVAFYAVVHSPPWMRMRAEAAWTRVASRFRRRPAAGAVGR
jgi:hypothetical protein